MKQTARVVRLALPCSLPAAHRLSPQRAVKQTFTADGSTTNDVRWRVIGW